MVWCLLCVVLMYVVLLCVVSCVLFDVVCLTLCVWRLVFDVWRSVRVLGCSMFVVRYVLFGA